MRHSLHLRGLGPALKEFVDQEEIPALMDMTNEREVLANMFYNQLAQLLKGTARKIAMQCEAGNGFEYGGNFFYVTRNESKADIKQCCVHCYIHPPGQVALKWTLKENLSSGKLQSRSTSYNRRRISMKIISSQRL